MLNFVNVSKITLVESKVISVDKAKPPPMKDVKKVVGAFNIVVYISPLLY